MKLSLLFAKRYLIAKKSHHTINLISYVSVIAVAIITMALICTLSVFNGFQDLITSLYSSFDSELKIEPVKGKTFQVNQSVFDQIREMPEVELMGEVLQEQVLVHYNGRQLPAVVKGVDSTYQKLTQIDSLLWSGTFTLSDPVVQYGSVGIGLASLLQVNAGFVRPLDIYVPNQNGSISLLNPASSFSQGQLFVGSVFVVSQAKYDDQYILSSIAFARRLFGKPNLVSSLELKVKEGESVARVKRKIQSLLGEKYRVLNQMEQQADSYRIMQIEKWMTFLILFFILIIASFNVIGSLSMLIVDKRDDVDTLRKLGADRQFIRRIFLIEGVLISGVGALVGLILGVLLCWVQQEYGLLQMGQSGGGLFIVDAYPVKLQASDVLAVTVGVALLGYLTALYPVRAIINKEFK